MSYNKVSIIVPCYKQAQYLDECLQSVSDQTYQDWECIIVNDGSPDNTEEVSKLWLQKDIRFKYVFKKNGGLSSARNYGIKQAKSELILPLDADDKIARDYLRQAIFEFQRDQTLKVVYSKAEKFGDETGTWYLPTFDISKLGLYNMIFSTALFRKSDWESVGGYDVNMVKGLEDWEFWIALLKNNGQVKQIDYVGFYYRIKENSMLQRLSIGEKKTLYEYMSIKHADFYVKHLGSFITLQKEMEYIKREGFIKVKSKKRVLNIFCKTFFGFYLFKINDL